MATWTLKFTADDSKLPPGVFAETFAAAVGDLAAEATATVHKLLRKHKGEHLVHALGPITVEVVHPPA